MSTESEAFNIFAIWLESFVSCLATRSNMAVQTGSIWTRQHDSLGLSRYTYRVRVTEAVVSMCGDLGCAPP